MNSLILALVLCGATVALASEHCSYEDADIVMNEWQHVLDGGNSAPILIRTANVIFSAMFEKDPSSRDLFNRVNVADMHSGEFHAHTLRVMTA
uniref:Hemoglobin subunit B1 n=1 Tax=Escarpia spicata TaxID=53617 RepID=A0A0S2MLL3_ESCSP|nr:hemoglobin subunit B1 [Escarpia spicata]